MIQNRRDLLKLLGMSPVAAPIAAQANAANYFSTVMGSGGAGVALGAPWVRSGLTKLLWKGLASQRQKLQQRAAMALVYRVGSLDPDIAAMKSLSPAYALHLQRCRDEALQEEIERLGRQLFPDVEND